MRIAGRVIASILLLAGIALFVVSAVLLIGSFERTSVLIESGPSGSDWAATIFFAALGLGSVFAGRYYWKLDLGAPNQEQEEQVSPFASYLLSHRRGLKLVAIIGLTFSLFRLAAALAGMDWMGLSGTWVSVLLCVGLAIAGGGISGNTRGGWIDWDSMPRRARTPLKCVWWIGAAVFWILVLHFGWDQWSHHAWSPVERSSLMALIFAWEVAYFTYGRVRSTNQIAGAT